jgi:hypothetical protein
MKHSMIKRGYSTSVEGQVLQNFLDENGGCQNGMWLSNTTENNILV